VRCPSCGAAFHCGVHDAAPCACTNVRLSDEQLDALRSAFNDCLCVRCLRAVAAGGPITPNVPSP
jgi:hypothetical protein